MIFPKESRKVGPWAFEIVERCRGSVPARASLARSQKTWIYSGAPDGNTAILNTINYHLKRKAALLYSSNDLRFHIDFVHRHDEKVLDQADIAAAALTKMWQRRDIDQTFGEGVLNALQYGSCFIKALDTNDGIHAKLVMPWQIGVYEEYKSSLSEQEAVCETSFITQFDLWRRISHLPNAPDLFKRATSYAKRKNSSDDADTFFHQVLIAGSSPAVQTDGPFVQQPGGLIQVSSDPMGSIISPQVSDELVEFHEAWIWDDEREDYTTVQMVAPDILICPVYKRTNFFVEDELPYTKIQPSSMTGYFFGRSDIADMMKLQHLLRDRLEDIKKLMALQYDRILAFIGNSGMTDEAYDMMKNAGFFSLEPGSDVKDLTPKLPEKAFEDVHEILGFINEVTGFQNILSGQGEPGVRSGNHASTLLKTAAPRMRDEALTIERNCADFAYRTFNLLAAKKAEAYWTKAGDEFLLNQLPDDMEIVIDSHSTSPIYADDHQQTAFALAKMGIITADDLIDLVSLPRRDLLKAHAHALAEKKAKEKEHLQQQLLQHPELAKALQGGHGHR